MNKMNRRAARQVLAVLLLSTLLESCSLLYPEDEEREEIVAGIRIPIPRGMNKSTEQRVDLALPGLEGGTVTYQGNVDPNKIVSFYQTEMPQRGWLARARLVTQGVTQGGTLAFSKDARSVLIRVSGTGGATVWSSGVTVLDILVAAVGLQSPRPFQEKSTESSR
jgi:hypothetical protein